MTGASGVAAWSSAGWRSEAVAWLDERLAAAGLQRTGEVEQPHLRPWATALRAPTDAGRVWLKACGPGTAFEAPLYEIVARAVPAHVLRPLAVDVARAWILLPDGGAPLRDRVGPGEQAAGLAAALVQFGRLQRALAGRVGDLLAAGVPDMRPAAMPGRLDEALAVVRATGGDPAVVRRAAARREPIARWCARLAASPVPPSLDHSDLHGGNVLTGCGDDAVFYDWGDSVVAHPFAVALVPLGLIRRQGELAVARARDAYLEVFADLAPHAELVVELELACRVAKVARVLTWERALRAVREQGEPVEPFFAAAQAQTLASLPDESYLLRG